MTSSTSDSWATNQRLEVRLSDPWELGELLSWEAPDAYIVAANTAEGAGKLILRLTDPFVFKDVRCEFFVARPRYEGDSISALLDGSSVTCNLTRIPPERLESPDPTDLSWWRGGVACIAQLLPSDQQE